MPDPHKYTFLKCSGVIEIVANKIRISHTEKKSILASYLRLLGIPRVVLIQYFNISVQNLMYRTFVTTKPSTPFL